nr:FixH family protein [Neobacillus sp. Marseille-Q6967]
MKKLLWISLALMCLPVISACNNNQPAEDVPEMIEVELTVTPEKGNMNEPVVFEAKVTQGDEAVEDAESVKFEIWRAHDEKHEKMDVKHAKNGIYRLEKTFQKEGTYYIISHVTARDMHNMPKKVFVIGSPSEPEDPNETKHSMEDMDMEEH